MSKTIGKVLLAVGLLTTAGIFILGWNSKVFDFSQTGAAIGLRRLFFYYLYLPIPMIIASVGFILISRDWLESIIPLKRIALVISAFLFLSAIIFVSFNVMGNIMHYGKENVLEVFVLNLIFTSPVFFLSGLLFLSSRVISRK